MEPIQIRPPTINFELRDLRRIPVLAAWEVRDALGQTTDEGRKFLQALADEFGKVPEADHILVEIHPITQHFEVAEWEKETKLIAVMVFFNDGGEPFQQLLHLADLKCLHASGVWGFHAVGTAQELVRLYRHKKRIQQEWEQTLA